MTKPTIFTRTLLALAAACCTPGLAWAQTDITDAGGTVSAQYADSPRGEDISKLTDNRATTKYLTFHASGWMQFRSASAVVVTKYALTSANDADRRDPKSWTFQGSTDGSTWTTLDTRSNEDFPTRLLRREFSFANSTAYTYYRLQATNNSGNILQLAEWEIYEATPPSNAGWENFRYPTVVFQDRSPSSQGSQIFRTAIPNPEEAMRAQILLAVKQLHYNAADNVRNFTKLTYAIEDYDGVASAGGSGTEINIRVSTRHLANMFNNSNGNYEAIRTEILGILSHEVTHGYQYNPKNAGSYTSGTEFFGFIEGTADAVRIAVGLHPGRTPRLGGTWKDGYTTSGFFIYWMMLKKDPNFLRKFQHTARTYATWSWDAACREILGTGVQPLWDEYQQWIRDGRAGLRAAPVAGVADMERYTCAPGAGTGPVAAEGLALFPNPVASTATLAGIKAFPAQVAVYDAWGNVVKHVQLTQPTEKTSLDLFSLKPGFYQIQVVGAGAVQTYRFEKQ